MGGLLRGECVENSGRYGGVYIGEDRYRGLCVCVKDVCLCDKGKNFLYL